MVNFSIGQDPYFPEVVTLDIEVTSPSGSLSERRGGLKVGLDRLIRDVRIAEIDEAFWTRKVL